MVSFSSKVTDRFLECPTIEEYSPPISLLSYSSSTLSRCLLNFDPVAVLLILLRPASDEDLLLA